MFGAFEGEAGAWGSGGAAHFGPAAWNYIR